MKGSLFAKCVGLAALAICSYTASSMAVQNSRAKAKSPVGDDGPRHKIKFPVFREISIGTVDVSASGNRLHVAFEAMIRERRPGFRNIWAIRISERAGGKVVHEKRYDHQAFVLPAGLVGKPTFEDTLVLPVDLKGRYLVEATIYSLPPDVATKALGDPAKAASYEGPTAGMVVDLGR